MLVPLNLPPGFSRTGTLYQGKGRWVDGSLVRWREAVLQPIGGWQRLVKGDGSSLTLSGVPRAVLAWRGNDGSQTLAFGTPSKLYAYLNGVSYDITPAGFTAGTTSAAYVSVSGGYGVGNYGAGSYGGFSGTQNRLIPASVWSLTTFGAYLVGCCATNDGKLYYWDRNVSNVAVVMSGAPTSNAGVVVTPERFVMALGAGGVARQVAWASQESLTDWTASATNTAGSFPLEGPGGLMAGRAMRGETLLWGDSDLHTARYIGGTLVYSFERLGNTCGLIAPGAVAVIDTQAVWMGLKQFFVYDGYVRNLASEVADYVFSDFNLTQRSKVTAQTYAEFGEVWWYYPSAASDENDRYVVWNYRDNWWAFGMLSRTCGTDRGAVDYPVACKADGTIWEHEKGLGMNSEGTPYAISGPVEFGQGDHFMLINRLIPDEKTLGDAVVTLYTANSPTATETARGPYTAAAVTNLRALARQVRVKIGQSRSANWRVGTYRVDVRPAGAR